jgi:pyruvate dehydrogenase E1 component
MRNIAVNQDPAVEAIETREWQDSLDYVLQQGGGVARAAELLRALDLHARQTGLRLAFSANTPFINTIAASKQAAFPGILAIESRIKILVRWKAL